MTPTPGKTPIPTLREASRYFIRLLWLVRRYWGQIFKGAFLGVVIGVFGMVTPYVSKLLIDSAYPTRDVKLMHVLVVGVAVITITSAAMRTVQGYYSATVSGRLGTATMLMFFNHLQHLSASFFDEHQGGEVMSRFRDIKGALALLSTVIGTFISSGVYLVLVPPVLLLLNWKLALLSVVMVPITVTVSTLSSRLVRKYYKENAEASAEVNAYEYEVFSHIRTLKAMAAEPHVYSRIEGEMHHALRTQLKASGVGAVVGLANGILRAAGMGLFAWYAWTLILREELSLGAFIAFSAYLGYFTGPVNKFASLFSGFQQAAVSLGRMFEYLDYTPEQNPTLAYSSPLPISHRIAGDIEFRSVSFAYNQSREILHQISLTASRGQVTAIVGPSGAGKSSLLRLVSRMASPSRGEVLIDGTSVGRISLPDLRRQIAVVWQEFSLLHGTVWDNLTMGLPNIARAAVEEAVHLCRLDDMIADLPDGYDSPVAEWGSTLSGGQRQRIAIARALARNTPVLLLDEATANVDIATEEAILRGIFARYTDKTIIFVTHRVATAGYADQVCVIDNGRLAAQGHPRDVAVTSDAYRALLHVVPGEDSPPLLRVVKARW